MPDLLEEFEDTGKMIANATKEINGERSEQGETRRCCSFWMSVSASKLSTKRDVDRVDLAIGRVDGKEGEGSNFKFTPQLQAPLRPCARNR